MRKIPIFIGGCDRSGTTLLGSMMGSHDKCVCVPESQFIIDIINGSKFDANSIDSLHILKLISNHPRFKLWGIILDPAPFAKRNRTTTYSRLIEWLVTKYGEANRKAQFDYWVDHTPSNVKYASALFSLYPNAKLIHIIRDGRSVASSIIPLNWGPKTIDQAAYFWLKNLSYGLAAESAFGPNLILRVKYEDLVLNPEQTLKLICEFINLDYQPHMINGTGFNLPAYTRKQHMLVGSKPDPSRINAWENNLSSREIEIFENITGDMLTYLGYRPKFGGKAMGLNWIERIMMKVKGLLMYPFNILAQIEVYIAGKRNFS